MKLSQLTRKILVIALIAAWGIYALLNLVSTGPYLLSAYQRTPGGTGQRLLASAEAANGKVLLQSNLQDVVGELRLRLGKKTIKDFSLVQGEDGQLIYTNYYPYETYADYDAYAQKMQQLSIAAHRQGASFLYLNCISLFSEEANSFGDLPVNDLNPRSDTFLYYLTGYGVDTLDARTVLKNSDLDPSAYRYKTEPHWTTQACFEVFTAVVDTLKARGSSIDPDGFYTDSANYRRDVYAQGYLGKLGKMAGATYAGYDDFMLITPTYETDFTISHSLVDDEDDIRGEFGETILDPHWMSAENIYDNDMYCLYLSEVYSYRKITNHLNTDGPRILVVGDSYMLPVTAFLATAASEVHLLSPYNLPDNTESLLAYLEEYDFDHVLVGLNPGTLYNTGWTFLEAIDPTQAAVSSLMATMPPAPAATGGIPVRQP